MENKEEIKIPYPKLTWKLIILVVLIILSFRLDTNKVLELWQEIFELVKNYLD